MHFVRRLPDTPVFYDIIPDPLSGEPGNYLRIACQDEGVTGITPLTQALPASTSSIWLYHPEKIRALKLAIEGFLQGNDVAWPMPVVMPGTEFQQSVWKEIAAIPYGQTVTYTELARRTGHPKAVRAAASACGANPVPLIVPCHRVIASDGGLGGFGWGIAYKKALLALERHAVNHMAA